MKKIWRQKYKKLLYLLLGIITAWSCITIHTSYSIARTSPPAQTQNPSLLAQTNNQAEQGAKLYQAGKFSQAATAFQQAAQNYQVSGNILAQAMALSNLSLTYQKLGLWPQAQEAISQSLNLIQSSSSPNSPSIKAQSLDILARLQHLQGQHQNALSTWQQTAQIYHQLENESGVIQSQLNQAQALRALGFYRRALVLLNQVQETLATQPDSATKVASLRSLGEIQNLVGDYETSQTTLEEGLAIAEKISSPHQASLTLISLGNTARAQQKNQEALNLYQKALDKSPSVDIQIKAQLNQLSLLITTKNEQKIPTLIKQIHNQLQQLPASRNKVYAQINLAKNLLNDPGNQYAEKIAESVSQTVTSARQLGDIRIESYALGTLGEIYEHNQQLQYAQNLTHQALALSETIDAPELSYLWYWQEGRLRRQLGDNENAIAAYENAVNLLKTLRSDLVTVNTDVQFSFRETVEPVYRQLVSLLLKDNGSQTEPKKLERARKVIESLQLAELDNYFRSACIDATPVSIEEVDAQAAVIYPIILPERLEVIVRIPGQPLRHHSTAVTSEKVEETANKLRVNLQSPQKKQRFLAYSQTLYEWLIQPAQEDLAQSRVNNLVFILDGVLRNIPMSVLYDGEKYLAQNYAVSLTPGLELLPSQPLRGNQLQVLGAGLSEARHGFPALPGVKAELEQIEAQVDSRMLMNQEFTEPKVQNALNVVPFPVVHLATHGQFSSKAEETFILTWDGEINVYELQDLLQTTVLSRNEPIELLVLSACQTAQGDKRAALGLAGLALRSGARSTMGSLWLVSDEATTDFMVHFYEQIAQPEITKAEALRRTQLWMLEKPKFEHPFYWAPFVLIGNWL